MGYNQMSKNELKSELNLLLKQYEEFKQRKLTLNMSRGVPSNEQLDISVRMLDIVNSGSDCKTQSGVDCRSYGLLDGLPSCKELFAQMMQVTPDMVMVGGNSSLNMMFDTISCAMTTPIVEGCPAWFDVKDRKFLCPVPGYDRHFGITEYFGFEMITVPMLETGPDMDIVEKLVAQDESIKGIWCVPKYSNPTGITFSDDTVKRFAALKPKAKDFRIMWDDAYCVHDISDKSEQLLSLYDECKKANNEDIAILFASTSKITFPGSGVAAMATSEKNMRTYKRKYTYQTIGYDKINMLRHMLFFKDFNGVLNHMKKHKEILKPRFDIVINALQNQLGDTQFASWSNPNGGYFVSVNVMNGTAKRVVQLCNEAGVTLTGAGATYPYGKDPGDSNIRIAPTFPSCEDLTTAMELFCTCSKLAAAEKLLAK